MLWRLPFWLLTADPEPVSPLPCCPPPLSPRVGLTNAWENSVAKNVDSLRICRFLLSIQFGGCDKRVENTFSLLASFFIFLLLFGQLCLRFVGEGQDRGRGSNTQRFFTFRLIAPPTQPDRDSSGQLSTVIFGLLSFVCLNIKILFATNFHWAVCFSTPVTLGDHATPTK